MSGEKSTDHVDEFEVFGDDKTSREPSWLGGVAGDGAVFMEMKTV